MAAMPTRWVSCAVVAAVVLGLTEVDVPPGAVVIEKLAALFPSLTNAVLALGTRLLDWGHPTPMMGYPCELMRQEVARF
jgi:hypothetical protein